MLDKHLSIQSMKKKTNKKKVDGGRKRKSVFLLSFNTFMILSALKSEPVSILYENGRFVRIGFVPLLSNRVIKSCK